MAKPSYWPELIWMPRIWALVTKQSFHMFRNGYDWVGMRLFWERDLLLHKTLFNGHNRIKCPIKGTMMQDIIVNFGGFPVVTSACTLWLQNCRSGHSTDITCCVQLKTFFLILYSLVAGLCFTCSLLYYFIYNDFMSQELTNHFTCESSGQEDCPASLTELEVFQSVLTTSVVLLILLPLVVLMLGIELSSRSCSSGKQEDTRNSSDSDLS